VVGMGTSPSSISRLMRSITSSGGVYTGFMNSLEPRGCPTNFDMIWLERGMVSLVVVAQGCCGHEILTTDRGTKA
jgi:hypothetical protein